MQNTIRQIQQLKIKISFFSWDSIRHLFNVHSLPFMAVTRKFGIVKAVRLKDPFFKT